MKIATALVFAFLLPLLTAATIIIRGPSVSAPAPTYLINQNFEGTGYDNSETWTENVDTGTVNEDYTSVAILGSQSLFVGKVGDTYSYAASPSFTGQTDAWAFAKIYIVGFNSTDADEQFGFWNGTYGQRQACGIRIGSAGDVKIYANGTLSSASACTLSTGVTYNVWIHFVSGGTCTLYVSQSTTRPTTDSASEVVITHTAASVSPIKVQCYNGYASGEFIFDHILVSSSEIGNNP